jgi:hypothetical protein
MSSLADRLVRVRPFRPDELDLVWSAHQAVRRDRSIPVLRGAKEGLRRMVRNSGSFVGDVLYLAVETKGRLVGEVDARRNSTGLPDGVVELGIELYDEQLRGKGSGRRPSRSSLAISSTRRERSE